MEPGQSDAALLEPAAEEQEPGSLRARHLDRTLSAFVILAWVSSVLARAITPALPGSSAGLGKIIQFAETSAGFATQLTVWFGVLLASGIVFGMLLEERLRGIYRFLTVMTTAAILALVMTATRSELQPAWGLSLAFLSAILAAQASAPALANARTRALALVLAGTALAATIVVLARLMALEASESADTSGFAHARWLATAAFVLDTACVALVGAWLLKPNARWRSGLVLGITVCAAFLAWHANRSMGEEAGMFTVLLERSLGELTYHPEPLVPIFARYFLEIVALCFTLACVLFRGGTSGVGPAVALVLLARGNTDAPAGALLLAIGSLAAADRGIRLLVHSVTEPSDRSDKSVSSTAEL